MKTKSTALEGIRKVRLVERELNPRKDEILVRTHNMGMQGQKTPSGD
jgi:hypothetical protein